MSGRPGCGPHERTEEEFTEHFWKQCRKESSGCWIWKRRIPSHGYGMIWRRGRSHRAHRMAWVLSRGPIPEGLGVLHTCDTPACVNPDHLFLGTDQDNMTDKKNKGRAQAGEKHGMARLTWEEVVKIRSIPAKYGLISQLARDYGVDHKTIWFIRHYQTWKL
jgi:hypothetical protein